MSSCFPASASPKSEANEFIEAFVLHGSKYSFDLSCIMVSLLVKEVFLCFNCNVVLYMT